MSGEGWSNARTADDNMMLYVRQLAVRNTKLVSEQRRSNQDDATHQKQYLRFCYISSNSSERETSEREMAMLEGFMFFYFRHRIKIIQ